MRRCSSRLRLPTLGGRDDEEARVDRADAREHVLDEAHVTGHVDEGDAALPDGSVGPREAEVDREAAALLLGEAVGVGAGEREDERRLAVVDVTRSRDDARLSCQRERLEAAAHERGVVHRIDGAEVADRRAVVHRGR